MRSIRVSGQHLNTALEKIIMTFERLTKRGERELPHSFFIMLRSVDSQNIEVLAHNRFRKLHISIPAVVEGHPFRFVSLGKNLAGIIRTLRFDRVEIEYPPAVDRIWIMGKSSRISLTVTREDVFPLYNGKETDTSGYMKVPLGELFYDLSRISYCAGSGSMAKPHNVCVSVTKDFLMCTDNRRMSVYPNRFLKFDRDFLIPLSSLHKLTGVFWGCGKEGGVKLNADRELSIISDGIYVSINLAAGEIPRFTYVIKPSFDKEYKCLLYKEEFVNVLERMGAVISPLDKFPYITLSLKEASGAASVMEVFVESSNNTATDSISVKYSGEGFRVRFNLQFLLQAARSQQEDVILLRFFMDLGCKSMIMSDTKREHLNVVLPIRGSVV